MFWLLVAGAFALFYSGSLLLTFHGSYDNLIARFQPLKQKSDGVCAFGVQIAVEKITAALAAFQSASMRNAAGLLWSMSCTKLCMASYVYL